MTLQVRKSKTHTPAPVGTHFARILGVTDLGHQPGFEWSGGVAESAYKIEVVYELVNTNMDESGKEKRPFVVSEEMTNTDSEKGKLTERALSLGLSGADEVAKMVNMPAMVTVSHNAKGYAKVANVSGIPMGTSVEELTNIPWVFSPSLPDVDLNVFQNFPEFRQNKLKNALDFEESQLFLKLCAEGLVDKDNL